MTDDVLGDQSALMSALLESNRQRDALAAELKRARERGHAATARAEALHKALRELWTWANDRIGACWKCHDAADPSVIARVLAALAEQEGK